MWKIKNPEALKEKINRLLSDEIVAQGCKQQMDDYSDYILLSGGFVSIRLMKERFEKVPEYDPEGWNDYSKIKPPRSGQYFIYLDDREIWTQRLNIGSYDAEFDNWKSLSRTSVLFFKECHEQEPEIEPHTDTH